MKITRAIAFFSMFFLISCKSTPKVIGEGDLFGLVVDEKNNPISDFIIVCEGKNVKKNITITNQSGIFIFSDMPYGEYEISGKKEGYVLLELSEYLHFSKDKIFCVKINSIDEALNVIEKQIELKNYEEAQELLDGVYAGDNKYEQTLLIFYQSFLEFKKGNKTKALEIIGNLKTTDLCGLENELSLMEEMINEEN